MAPQVFIKRSDLHTSKSVPDGAFLLFPKPYRIRPSRVEKLRIFKSGVQAVLSWKRMPHLLLALGMRT
jgi:hypothetical protein